MSDGVDLEEFRSAYVIEAQELVTSASAHLLAIETALRRGAVEVRGVRELFRAVHTIKGLSAMVGVEPVVAIAHRLETSLRTADRSGGRLALGSVDTLLEGVRAIEQRVRAVAERRPVPAAPAALLRALDQLDDPPRSSPTPPGPVGALDLDPGILARLTSHEREQLAAPPVDGRRAVRIDFVPSPAKAEAGISITTVRARVAKLGEIVKVIPIAVTAGEAAPGGLVFALLVLTAAADEALAAAVGAAAGDVRSLGPPPPAAAPAMIADQESDGVAELEDAREGDTVVVGHGVVRVEVARLDDAMERLSVLVVTRFRLARAVARLAEVGVNVRDLAEIVSDNARQLRDLRAAILRIRMVQVSELLQRIPLLVRGVARATGKLVRLELDGGGAELDKSVAERIFPALVHLVRNAVDHAIETPDERRSSGKLEEGTLRITCHERSNTQLELVISDDGRGVDRRRVAERAGREPPESDAALLELLCLPGLSTREQVTTTSGRGMGLDIVKRIIVDQLGGELLLATTPGEGTRFVLHIPLTISIVDAFTFECAAHRFVVPVSMVEEILEIDPARLVRAPQRRGRRAHLMLLRRDGAVPLVRLDALFRIGDGSGGGKALVVRRNGEALAFAVDRILGQQEVVVRPLEDPLVKVSGIAGATDLGDGRPTLVLDLAALGATLGAATRAEMAS